MTDNRYDHRQIEQKWQDYWLKHKTFSVQNPEAQTPADTTKPPSIPPSTTADKYQGGGNEAQRPKYYVLDMFPYPSGAGLHVGHPEGYTATDIIARYKRMQGFDVLHPMGWDAFGLPAENYAIKTGEHPEKTTKANIATFKRQIQSLGFSYDWEREFSTTDPAYYKHTQWIFLQMYKKGLLYEKKMPMNWCPSCRIVAANEEVENGQHERCGTEVEKRDLTQWMFRITDYAERLLADLDELTEWPEKIIAMQKNWIGKSEGAEVQFKIKDSELKITVYTTRPDTLFGATYMVLSPEHELVRQITTAEQNAEVEKYVQDAAKKSEIDRTDATKEKTGVFTGAHAVNPVNGEEIPIWIADYVLSGYGTGAIMAVPAHDERDWEFSEKHRLKKQNVVKPTTSKNIYTFPNYAYGILEGESDEQAQKRYEQNEFDLVLQGNRCFPYAGIAINSGFLDGLPTAEAKEKMIEWLEEKGVGKRQVNYKLRDWIFTRQRYWGEPIPLVKDEEENIYPLDESELPVKLPEANTFLPTEDGQSPLAKIRDWVEVRGEILENGSVKLSANGAKRFFRETSTMPNWAGSNWYWLRFMDAKNENEPWSQAAEQYWGPVDLYVGGAEHAVLHLLYSRFWHKVFYDMGLVHTKEPFKKLMNQGLILAEDGQKMSKSLGNVVNPDEIVERYGADTLRMYEMFMGPFEQSKAWSTGSVEGTYKFLQRIWRVFQEKEIASDMCPGKDFQKLVHKTIKKVTHDIEEFKFNTAISQMMILVNAMQKLDYLPVSGATKFVKILAPFAPHLAEELWQTALQKPDSLAYADWPEWDEALTQDDEIDLAIQVNGKLRATIRVPADITKEDAFAQAKEQDNVRRFLAEKDIVKEIYVPGKIVNLVVK